MSPNRVNKNNEKKFYILMYGTFNSKKPTNKFNKSIFEKGYPAKWTEEIFRIKKLIPLEPIVYINNFLNRET
jgi:hypothetical protein